jgi:hypothetical protein
MTMLTLVDGGEHVSHPDSTVTAPRQPTAGQDLVGDQTVHELTRHTQDPSRFGRGDLVVRAQHHHLPPTSDLVEDRSQAAAQLAAIVHCGRQSARCGALTTARCLQGCQRCLTSSGSSLRGSAAPLHPATEGTACANGKSIQPSSWAKRRNDRSAASRLDDGAPPPPHTSTTNRVTAAPDTAAQSMPSAPVTDATNGADLRHIAHDAPLGQAPLAGQIVAIALEQLGGRPIRYWMRGRRDNSQPSQVLQQWRHAPRRHQITLATGSSHAEKPGHTRLGQPRCRQTLALQSDAQIGRQVKMPVGSPPVVPEAGELFPLNPFA